MNAADLLKILTEAEGGSPVSLSDLKAGDQVIFAPGTELEGSVAIVVDTHADRGTVDLKVGNATKMDVPASDLLSPDASAPVSTEAPADDTPASEPEAPAESKGRKNVREDSSPVLVGKKNAEVEAWAKKHGYDLGLQDPAANFYCHKVYKNGKEVGYVQEKDTGSYAQGDLYFYEK